MRHEERSPLQSLVKILLGCIIVAAAVYFGVTWNNVAEQKREGYIQKLNCQVVGFTGPNSEPYYNCQGKLYRKFEIDEALYTQLKKE